MWDGREDGCDDREMSVVGGRGERVTMISDVARMERGVESSLALEC
jgi:hypothetical protein